MFEAFRTRVSASVSSDSNTTGSTDKLRSLVLSWLVVVSVFAGTVAFSGGVAAAANVGVEQAGEYSDSGDGASTVELALSDPVTNGLDGNGELELYLDGKEVSDSLFDGVARDGTAGRVAIELSRDVTPNQNLTVKLTDFGSGSLTARDVAVTSRTFTPDSGDRSYTNLYHGVVVAIEDADAGSDTALRIERADGGIVFQDDYVDNSQVFVVDTADLDPGQDYDITSGADTAGFKVNDLGLDVEMTESNVSEEDAIVAEVTAIRGGTAATATLSDSDGETVDSIATDLESTETVEFDFGPRSTAGSPYTVTVTDTQTGITADSEEVSVTESIEGEVQFAERVVADDRGDVVSVTFDLSNTDEGYVTIGDKSEANYAISGQITDDDDGDGEVTVEFNSYLAGVPNSGNATVAASDVLSATGDDDISGVSEHGSFERSDLTADTLAAGSYPMNATAGTSHSDSPDSVGTLRLRDRSTDRIGSWVAPLGASLSSGDIYDRVGHNLTRADEIADGDVVVHRVTASGIEGPLDYREDVRGAGDTTAAFLQATGDSGALDLWVNRTNVGANADGDPLQLNASNTVVVDDPDNDTYFVAVELADAEYRSDTPVHDGDADELTAGFSVTGTTGLADSADSVEDTYEITDRDATLTTTDDVVLAQAAADQPVTGTTSVAPGSELTVRLASESDANPFISRPGATVTRNGTFTATADMSGHSVGTNFTATALDVTGEAFGTAADGQIVAVATTNGGGESTGANGTDYEGAAEDTIADLSNEPTESTPGASTERPTATLSTPTPSTVAPTETATTTERTDVATTAASGPGFTVGVAVLALVAAALLTVRRGS
ncbi:DUF7827 domain-containing protein [Haloarcula brevis]|uniref:DUF7827 domain-containing protein n=1 Tax=Haloarcula brevis TaxID=3111453 RepID=UPI00300F75BD